MDFKKNDVIELEITDIGVNGEGVGRYNGCTFFVKDALAGDRVRAVITRMKKGYGYGKMLEILEPSGSRVPPLCENARRCGGCQIMELRYDEQLRLKERKIRNNLEKIGGFQNPEILPILGMHPEASSFAVFRKTPSAGAEEVPEVMPDRYKPIRFRNKMQFPIGRDRDGNLVAGFYAGRTHTIINSEDCVTAPEVLSRILSAVRDFLEEYKISVYNENSGQGLVRHLVLRMGFWTGEIMVCLVLNGKSLNDNNYSQNVDYESVFVDKLCNLPLSCDEMSTSPGEVPDKNDDRIQCKALPSSPSGPNITSICINENRENTNVILGKNIRCIYGRPYIFDEIVNREDGRRLKFKISPLSFYQVNPLQTETLYTKALEFADLSGTETVWDLYCGIGTISLFLASKAKQVMGVEIVPDAIRDAKENAERNGIKNAVFFCGRSEEIFPEYLRMQTDTREAEAAAETVVVLDPPRKGCDRKLLDAILEAGPEKIVYVSCDSATLARDLKILTGSKAGTTYQIKKIQPVDMFPHSVHVETVCQLIRRKPDAYVHITVDMEDYYRIKGEKGNCVKDDNSNNTN